MNFVALVDHPVKIKEDKKVDLTTKVKELSDMWVTQIGILVGALQKMEKK